MAVPKNTLFVVVAVLAAALFFEVFFTPGMAFCAEYYVDSSQGSDENDGLSRETPWQTLDKVNGFNFQPGDKVFFRSGGVWTGDWVGLDIRSSGSMNKPITFMAYGEGDRPVFTATDKPWAVSIRIAASWIVIDGFAAKDSFEAGFIIEEGANNNVVTNCEVAGVGLGIQIAGMKNRIIGNHVHDLHMIANTPGGDDDYGAVGVWLSNGANEVSHNRLENCKAPSHDYGLDGGAVEIYAESNDINGNLIMFNQAFGCEGFIEIGSADETKQIYDNIVAYNLSVNNRVFFDIHLGGLFAADVKNLRFENNTVVEMEKRDKNENYVFGFDGAPDPNDILMYNNIFYIGDYWFVADTDRQGQKFEHRHNLYFLGHPDGERGFPLGPGDKMGDPLFVDAGAGNYGLRSGSPAIDAGTDLGYSTDLAGRPVPSGSKPDIGAYEYQSIK